ALISNVWEVGVDDDITTFRERSQEVGVHSGSRVVFRRAVLRVLVHSVLPAAIVVAAIHVFFFSSRRRHTRSKRDWSSDVGSSDLPRPQRHRRLDQDTGLDRPRPDPAGGDRKGETGPEGADPERTAQVLRHPRGGTVPGRPVRGRDRKSTRLNSSHVSISYAVFCVK